MRHKPQHFGSFLGFLSNANQSPFTIIFDYQPHRMILEPNSTMTIPMKLTCAGFLLLQRVATSRCCNGNLSGNFRYALLQFRLSPVFTTAAVLTLALGIGGTTAIFTLIHAVMLRSLPVFDPASLSGLARATIAA
jgi:hypothetical protein